MLDRRDAPEPELVGGLDEVDHPVDDLVVALDVAAERPQAGALLLAVGRQDGIQLENRLDHGSSNAPLDGPCGARLCHSPPARSMSRRTRICDCVVARDNRAA
jgi:hypothetical protein